MTHAELSHSLIRPPGVPPSNCAGTLRRVDGSGDPIPDGSPPVYDQAQGDEGGPNDAVPVELLRCSLCRGTIPVSTGTDGGRRARNDWQKPAAATA